MIVNKRTKYNVAKETLGRTYGGIVFDSAAEMKYYRDVILPQIENGSIVCCERQKIYILQRAFYHLGKKILPIEYKADFYIMYSDGREVVIDIKGCPDAIAKLKRKMFWCVYPNIDYKWLSYSKIDGGWSTYEDVTNGRKKRKKEKQKLKESKEYEKK